MPKVKNFKHAMDSIKTFTLVFIDDEIINYKILKSLLKEFNYSLYWENNGNEGIKTIKNVIPELILLDIELPSQNGFEICEQLKNDPTLCHIPIIFLSSNVSEEYIEKGFLVGGADYITKPFRKREVIARIGNQIEKYLLKLDREKTFKELEQKNHYELEHLRNRQNYHEIQQETAFKKQIKITQDALTSRKIGSLFFEAYYRPLDIMSGDMYGTVKLADNIFLYYIIDAMGKGLSASISSVQSLSIIKKIISSQKEKQSFDFKNFVSEYVNFIQNELLNNEIICILLTLIDTQNEKMAIASFGMPPVIIEKVDDFMVIRNNNLPISVINDEINIDSICISGFKKILAYSDGFDEALCQENQPYSIFLAEDLKNTFFLNDLMRLRQKRVSDMIEDDITVIFIRRFEETPSLSHSLTLSSELSEIKKADTVLEPLVWLSQKYPRQNAELAMVIAELTMNALEYGSFKITKKAKRYAVTHNTYENDLEKMSMNPLLKSKIITIDAKLYQIDTAKILSITVIDEGTGFDVEQTVKEIHFETDIGHLFYHGRGIKIVKSMVDAFFFNEKGNEITLFKIFS